MGAKQAATFLDNLAHQVEAAPDAPASLPAESTFGVPYKLQASGLRSLAQGLRRVCELKEAGNR